MHRHFRASFELNSEILKWFYVSGSTVSTLIDFEDHCLDQDVSQHPHLIS